jgi:ATP-dependent Clp protease ATP-binding subunit ClpC
MKAVQQFMRPELVNRIDHIIFFDYLGKDAIERIARKIITAHREKLLAEHHLTLAVTDDAFDYLVEKGYDRQFGVRELKRVIDKSLLHMITNYIFDHEVVAGKHLACHFDVEKGLDLRQISPSQDGLKTHY